MEKQTRINKYKELRDEMKEEVAIDRQMTFEQEDEEDDFLSFLPHNHQKDIQDTLMEPLSYETLKPDNEEIKTALNEAKVNVGKEEYNTRLDILNKIKQSEEHQPQHAQSLETQQPTEPQKKMSLLEKLAAMSPEEDAEELKKYEEGLTVADFMKEDKKKTKREKVEKTEKVEKPKHQEEAQVQRQKEPIVEEEDVEEDSKLVTILNYVIIAFIIVFIVLAVFIVKQLLF